MIYSDMGYSALRRGAPRHDLMCAISNWWVIGAISNCAHCCSLPALQLVWTKVRTGLCPGLFGQAPGTLCDVRSTVNLLDYVRKARQFMALHFIDFAAVL